MWGLPIEKKNDDYIHVITRLEKDHWLYLSQSEDGTYSIRWTTLRQSNILSCTELMRYMGFVMEIWCLDDICNLPFVEDQLMLSTHQSQWQLRLRRLEIYIVCDFHLLQSKHSSQCFSTTSVIKFNRPMHCDVEEHDVYFQNQSCCIGGSRSDAVLCYVLQPLPLPFPLK